MPSYCMRPIGHFADRITFATFESPLIDVALLPIDEPPFITRKTISAAPRRGAAVKKAPPTFGERAASRYLGHPPRPWSNFCYDGILYGLTIRETSPIRAGRHDAARDRATCYSRYTLCTMVESVHVCGIYYIYSGHLFSYIIERGLGSGVNYLKLN